MRPVKSLTAPETPRSRDCFDRYGGDAQYVVGSAVDLIKPSVVERLGRRIVTWPLGRCGVVSTAITASLSAVGDREMPCIA